MEVDSYQIIIDVTLKKVCGIWQLKYGDKEVTLPQELAIKDKLDLDNDMLVDGDSLYQIKERNGYFIVDVIDEPHCDEENTGLLKIDGDKGHDDPEMTSVNPYISPKHEAVELSNQNGPNMHTHDTNDILISRSADLGDSIGTTRPTSENLSISDTTRKTDVLTTAENTSKTSDQPFGEETNEHGIVDSLQPPFPIECHSPPLPSTDGFTNVSNSLPHEGVQLTANQSTSNKSDSGIGRSTKQQMIVSPSESKEHDRNKSMAPPPLPLSLTKDDFVTEKGSRSTASSKGQGQEFEIHLSVKYQRTRDFSSDLSIRCNLDTYMRWHYVLENVDLWKKKQDTLKARRVHVFIEKVDEEFWVNIDVGKLEEKLSGADSEKLRDDVIMELMLGTETLVMNGFKSTGIDMFEAVKIIMKKSTDEMGNELWVYPDTHTDVIHYVYPETRCREVDTCIQDVIKTLQKGVQIQLPLIFSKVFEHIGVKQALKKEYSITMAVDYLESENKCRVTLKGEMSQVQKGESWINMLIDKYSMNEISFNDIKKLGTTISEEVIAEDVLSQEGFKHVSWYISESCRKISIISRDRGATDKATAVLKRSVRKEVFALELYQSLADVQAVKEGRAILEKRDNLVQIIGTDKALTCIKEFVRKFKNNRQEKITEKCQGNIDNDQSKDSEVTETTISFVVENMLVFKRLCDSEQWKTCADKYNVEVTIKDKRGFIFKGSSYGCGKVKESLHQMLVRIKQNISANVIKDTCTLSNGNSITVQYPTNMSDVNIVVPVDTVAPNQAKFDREQKILHLPRWIDGSQKEKEKTESSLKELLAFILGECLCKVQIDLPEIHKKIAKNFTHGLFTSLSSEEFNRKPPIELFICTDNHDISSCLRDAVETCEQMVSLTLPGSTSVSEKNGSPSEAASGSTLPVPRRNVGNDDEPEEQTIDDREDGGGGVTGCDQHKTWTTEKDVSLTGGSWEMTDNYVLVKDIPAKYTESNLRNDVKGCCPKLKFCIIYAPGMSEAIIKCKNKKDTKELSGKKLQIIKFTQFPAQSMMQFSTKLEYPVEKQIVQSLEKKDIKAKVNEEKTSTCITTPTELQLKYVLSELGEDEAYGVRTRNGNESLSDFVEVTEDVWDIVEIVKKSQIAALQRDGKEIRYHERCVIFSDIKKKLEDPNWTVVKLSLESLKHMQIIEVTINENRINTVKKWCLEIENEQKKGCCVFVEKRKTVLMYDESYENLQKIKHQLLYKDGQLKPTGRKKRMFNDTDNILAADKANEQNNFHSAILPDVEARSKPCNSWNQEDRKTQRLIKKQEFNLMDISKNLQVYSTDESIKIYVYEANILKLPVDCIVNAANDTLQHGGGVAKVIARAAGKRLDDEGSDYIATNGNIPVGKTCVTTAGNLHYDCVIHAVGPCWLDYRPHSFEDVQACEKDLYSAVMESLLAAEERGLESIALPAISAAIFGVPEEVCVYHYAKATIDYSKRKSSTALKEIHFIDINSKIIRSIQNMFGVFLRYNRTPDYSTDKFVQTKVNSPRSKSPERTDHRRRDTDAKIVYTYYTEGSQHIIETAKCSLVIQHGDIMQIKAMAIVSVEDSKGSGRGKIAQLIERKIVDFHKDRYLKNKKGLFSKDRETGDVIVTEGFNSGYKYILHAVLPHDIRNFPSVDRENTVKRTFEKILETLVGRSVPSIVMCLLGAGEETKEEIGVAAVSFIKAFRTYCEMETKEKAKHLQITLVCRQENILNWVLEKFRDHRIIENYNEIAPAIPQRQTKKPENKPEDLDNKDSLEDCVICMEKITEKKVLKCGHAFDKDCIKQAFRVKKVCPTCGMVCGKLKGDQPEGQMTVNIEEYRHCAGYNQCGRISITYTFPSGQQGPDHPNPGKHYRNISRTAYLPDNDEGNEVLQMLRIAFDRKLTFTIGTSRTSGEEGVITWNDIHHKTDPKPNTQFGYPDATYFERVKDELAAKGITPEQIRETH